MTQTHVPVTTERPALQRIIDPRSIAIIGASTNPAKRGYQAVRALQQQGYRHPIYPVNPTAHSILGLAVIASIEQLPADIDVALIALPGPAVPEVLRRCAAAGIAGAVVLANGFRESGLEGARLEAELTDVIRDTGIRVVGPNTSGLLNVGTGANLVGMPDVPSGAVSVLTQSGNMLLSLVNDARAVGGIGFSTYIGLGNQTDVRYDECLIALTQQIQTGAIAVHAEGFTDGRAFLVATVVAAQHKPVVVLRGGRTGVGQRVALSHTGSVAGSDAVTAAVLRQAGAEVVARSDELAIVTGGLATTASIAPGTGVAILSDGGGHAALAADALTGYGVELADLGATTKQDLQALLGEQAAVRNPVDVAGATDADPGVFVAATEMLMADPAVGLVLIVGMYGGYHQRFGPHLEASEDRAAIDLLALSATHHVPLLVQSCYARSDLPNHNRLRAGGVLVINSIDHAARLVAALDRRGTHRATAHLRTRFTLPAPAAPIAGSGVLDEPTARRVLDEAGIGIGPWRFAGTAAEVTAAVATFDRPCAIKIVSPQIVHKSDVGGVALNVVAAAAADTVRDIVGSVTRRVPGAVIDGFVITPMAERGVELLVGATRDPIFGPVVAFGSGGVLVEALEDVTFRAAPLTELEAREMIDETIAARMLSGFRGLPEVDRTVLARFLVRLGDFVAAHPEIAELDLNPVIASGAGTVPVDVRIVLS